MQPFRVGVNDPTAITPMPKKPLRLDAARHPATAPSPAAGEPTRTVCLRGPHVTADGQSVAMPRIGDLFLGFKIVDKLGEGGFGSVFLAEQLGLAARPVALKFTSRPNHEPERLASLQHTNIVPVYSVHTMPPIQVLCMPYMGRQTLHDVLQLVTDMKMLPATGAGLLSTVNALKPDTRKASKSKSRSGDAAKAAESGRHEVPRPQPVRELLGRLSFPDSVAWLFTRLAEALAHAHDRGILHLDLKPSNVLITDDGVPMILDFGLAHDLRSGEYDQTGGTLRYMAPEQLAAYAAQRGAAPDARMDLYSLGIMFFELLTGQHPFERAMVAGLPMPEFLEARSGSAPRPRTLNPKIEPAIEAIVLKLLEPDVERRYRSATELLTDLTLHRENRPLKFTRNPSFAERLRKYRRRHPVLAMMFVAAALGLTTFGAAGAAIREARQRTGVEASLKANRLGENIAGLRIDLTTLDRPKTRAEALTRSEAWFEHYGVTTDSKWREQLGVRRLSEAERDRLAQELGELALLSANAERMNANGKPDDAKAAALQRALKWNRTAQNCYEGYEVPLAVREQRVRLAAELGQPELADELDAANCRKEGTLEYYLRGWTLLADGKYYDSAESLETLVEKDAGHAAGQFALGVAYQYLGRYTEAAERYQLAKALSPHDFRPAYNRGTVLIVMGRLKEAEREYSVAIDREPKHPSAYYHRAIARHRLGQYDDAAADATRALELGEPAFRTFLLRASIRAGRKPDDAARDLAAAAKLEPHDEADYVARGNSKLPKDAAGALADYAKAAELNPRYLAAWQNQSHVLAEYLDQPDRSLDMLDRAVEVNPGFAPALVGRAVIHARLGKREEALKAAEAALKQSDDSLVRFQVACAYALSAKANPDDARPALDHLRKALRDGYSDFRNIAKDGDLDGIRELKEFKTIVDSAKELYAK